ncbi:uncharacterized protein LOC132707922 isoform X1 [Cylas formicarius]|uniref:uncharacterized protein LOC132707922 isoform X1 n=1 Tax=Cylas formicarius TaxID=197179 RepID=UPI0029586FD0|nr:uncharacterized protein LOC132707922 isoform X1 [Cylas formicarius]XP_060535945.1 uncharacterized protein LOC132707922 isoform X1 [Cylas formicarius]
MNLLVLLGLILVAGCHFLPADHLAPGSVFWKMLTRIPEEDWKRFLREHTAGSDNSAADGRIHTGASQDDSPRVFDIVCLPLPIGCFDPDDPGIIPSGDASVHNLTKSIFLSRLFSK